MPCMSDSAREWYEDGIDDHYRSHGASYRNPHEPQLFGAVARALREWPMIDTSAVLDLAAGSGELTRAIRAVRPGSGIVGCDPFTGDAYRAHAGDRFETLSFEQIAAGALRERRFTLIGCSFAMHLCPASLLPQLALELAQVSPHLLILTPHKRPILREAWGWHPVGEFVEQRVRVRLHASNVTPSVDTLPAP